MNKNKYSYSLPYNRPWCPGENSSFNLGTPEGWMVIAISWLFYVQGRYLVPTVQEAG